MTTTLSDLVANIAERGLTLLDPAWRGRPEAGADHILDLCTFLLSGRGEASAIAVAREILDGYAALADEEKRTFFRGLADRFGADLEAVAAAAERFGAEPTQASATALHFAAEPSRQELIRRLNRAASGTSALVALRADLLRLAEAETRDIVDQDFRHLFGSWFNRGFLALERVDWRTSASILEKIIAYEAVHEISGWDDLRRRVDASDRRLYAFFHPALVDEPLVFVEVALTTEIPKAIDPILAEERVEAQPEDARVAVFYAISNCQAGLRGITFGSFLIKQVIEELRKELPDLKTFATLSPLPRFRPWLDRLPERRAAAEEPDRLATLAALYLVEAKRGSGEPVDPVARLHLRNGARLERINTAADGSPKGAAQSYGVMVNYLYDPGAIERNHEAFANRREVATSPAVKRLLRRGRAKERTTAMAGNMLIDRFHASASDRDAVFMRGPDGVRVTYGDLFARSAQYANVLAELGVKPGDRVAVQARKSIEAILFYVAVIRCGAVYLPLNTAYTPAEVAYFLGDARPTALLVDADAVGKLGVTASEAGVAHVVTLDRDAGGSLAGRADGAPTEFEDIARGPDDLAAILYTSGTTGRSKGAMLTHDNLASNAEALREIWRFTSDDVLIHALPIFHTHGLFVATNVTLVSGSLMIVLPKFDAEAILDLLPEATCLMGVPTFYTRLLATGRLTPQACETMRLFISGSAPLLASTHDAFRDATGHAILERYGMTEANMITSNPYDGDRRAGTVGFPLPGVDVRIADADTGAPLAQGEIGVVEVKGPNVFSGYWRMPEKTKAEFRNDGYFISGDLGRIDEDGYLSIVGRGKDLIISGGLNVYPKEVETAIDALPGVAESAVIGVPHHDFGEGVVAVVVAEDGATLDENDMLTALGDRLAKFKQPKAIVAVDALPRNTMGKVQKNVLRETYAELLAAQGAG